MYDGGGLRCPVKKGKYKKGKYGNEQKIMKKVCSDSSTCLCEPSIEAVVNKKSVPEGKLMLGQEKKR